MRCTLYSRPDAAHKARYGEVVLLSCSHIELIIVMYTTSGWGNLIIGNELIKTLKYHLRDWINQNRFLKHVEKAICVRMNHLQKSLYRILQMGFVIVSTLVTKNTVVKIS